MNIDLIKLIYILIGVILTTVMFYYKKDSLDGFLNGEIIGKSIGILALIFVMLFLVIVWPFTIVKLFFSKDDEDEQ